MLRTYGKPQRLIKHSKISYSIASLVFCKCSCVIYRNGPNRGTSKLRHSKYLKKYEPCQLIPFVENLHFSILVHRVRYPKNLFVSRKQQIIIFPGEFKIQNYGRASINSRCLLLGKDMFFGKPKFDVKQLKINKFIKSIWQLIISTSKAALEVLCLRP